MFANLWELPPKGASTMFARVSLRAVVLTVSILVLFRLSTSELMAQTASLAVNSVSINISPTATDSYVLQGTIQGLNLTDASYVLFSVGNFGATFAKSVFVQQPGTQIFTYQDSTGQAPGWISSLTIDLDAGTFKAQANSIVLAGLTNPFVVQLLTDQSASCTMVRVQQSTANAYQLTPSDPTGMTCELATPPVTLPNVVQAGTATNVTIDVNPLQLNTSDIPQSMQLYRADDNAQPLGGALCTLALQSSGDYLCTVSFNEANPGAVDLLVEATIAGHPVLSPGFTLNVAAPATTEIAQQLLDVENDLTRGSNTI